MRSGGIVVDMTTSKPSLAQEIAKRALERGIAALDAPVSGGDVGAKNATLSIMVSPLSLSNAIIDDIQIGGDENAVTTVRPMLQCMGKNLTHLGGAGMGQHTKMVNQVSAWMSEVVVAVSNASPLVATPVVISHGSSVHLPRKDSHLHHHDRHV